MAKIDFSTILIKTRSGCALFTRASFVCLVCLFKLPAASDACHKPLHCNGIVALSLHGPDFHTGAEYALRLMTGDIEDLDPTTIGVDRRQSARNLKIDLIRIDFKEGAQDAMGRLSETLIGAKERKENQVIAVLTEDLGNYNTPVHQVVAPSEVLLVGSGLQGANPFRIESVWFVDLFPVEIQIRREALQLIKASGRASNREIRRIALTGERLGRSEEVILQYYQKDAREIWKGSPPDVIIGRDLSSIQSADAWIVLTRSGSLPSILRDARETDVVPGITIVTSETPFQGDGFDLEDLYWLSPPSPSSGHADKALQLVIDGYAKRYRRPMTFNAGLGFTAMTAVLNAMMSADESKRDTRAAVRKALLAIRLPPDRVILPGMGVDFDPYQRNTNARLTVSPVPKWRR